MSSFHQLPPLIAIDSAVGVQRHRLRAIRCPRVRCPAGIGSTTRRA